MSLKRSFPLIASSDESHRKLLVSSEKMLRTEMGPIENTSKSMLRPSVPYPLPVTVTTGLPASSLLSSSGRGAIPVRRLILHLKRPPPMAPADYEEVTWQMLEECLTAIQKSQPVQHPLETLYRRIESQCLLQAGPTLYAKLLHHWTQFAMQLGQTLSQSIPVSSSALLRYLDTEWQRYTQQSIFMRQLFLYMDRTMTHPMYTSLWHMAWHLFAEHVMTVSLQEQFTTALCQVLETWRRDPKIALDRPLLKRCLEMTWTLQLFQKGVVPRLLESMTRFYEQTMERAFQQLQSNDTVKGLIHFLDLIQSILEREQELASSILPLGSHPTRDSWFQLLEKTILLPYLERVCQCQSFAMLLKESQSHSQQSLHTLQQFYLLCRRVQLFEVFRQACAIQWRQSAHELMEQLFKPSSATENNVIQTIWQCRQSLFALVQSMIVEETHQHISLMQQTIVQSLEQAIRPVADRFGLLLAQETDQQWIRSSMDEERMILLFRLLPSKDVYESALKQCLAQRLLPNSQSSTNNAHDLDETMKPWLHRLKQECGPAYTTRMEGMIKDIEVSRQQQQQRVQETIRVHVLTAAYWPSYTALSIHYPKVLKQWKQQFESIYGQQHASRRLTWLPLLGTMILRYAEKEWLMTELQAMILLAFESVDQWELNLLAQSMGLQGTDRLFKDLVQSLSTSKCRLLQVSGSQLRLVKVPAVQGYRIRVPTPTESVSQDLLETPTTTVPSTILQTVQADRLYVIDAAIVRIMKARKERSHTLLYADVLQSVSFQVSATDFKKRVDLLLEREFLEQAQNDQGHIVYVYVA